ncbi:MAG: hypothetical protein US86_C0001G0277 [Candidatus Daviesbacteria bacterium GW2011_GWA2_38_24]|uniref:Uncharacterized protein n=1 Tax=Candidatus Daviesbacteria bacterium GW2011_GWA2_38_24 TaxID=1618422 RepID=A0A0G0JW63_9BACT|nr:MAG: hypothetical protein US86_C0001G0277 [Candidatus Daviesbacteria bacterium GW2011_GWA2_38_24]KKQ78649.1 MAG: hypothetical protein UT01_C0064G0021 [Candidatus Daviesbacteria bacterium GW2011_GWA1_38_7]
MTEIIEHKGDNSYPGLFRPERNRFISDIHGCLLQRIIGIMPAHYIGRSLTDIELDYIDFLTINGGPEELLSYTKPFNHQGLLPIKVKTEEPLPPQSFRERISRKKEKWVDKLDFVNSYYMPEGVRKMLKSVGVAGGEVTAVTGSPEHVANPLINKFEKEEVMDALANDVSICLTPTRIPKDAWPELHINSAGVKLLLLNFLEIIDGEMPWGIMEDALEIAEYYAYKNNARVFIPLPEKVARSRRRFNLPNSLLRRTLNGEIRFGMRPEDVLEEYLCDSIASRHQSSLIGAFSKN